MPIFKIAIDLNGEARLSVFLTKSAPWFQHVHHDALSESMAFMCVVTKAIDIWRAACYAFSSTREYLVTSMGLNSHKIRRLLSFPDAEYLITESMYIHNSALICTFIYIFTSMSM